MATRTHAAGPVLLALVLAACSGGDDDTSTAPTSPATAPPSAAPTTSASTTSAPASTAPPSDVVPQPVPGGTLRFGVNADVDGLNPTASALSAAAGMVMASAVFDQLADLTPDGRAVPYLAESFTPNADGTVWDVKLRPGVLFHDGTPLDAEAVRVNFVAQYESPLVGLALRNLYADSGAAEVIDPLTVRYHLTEPNLYWPAAMASQLGMMASPAWIAAAKDDPTLNQQPVGTGPFRFERRSEDSVTRLVRNDDWWNGTAYLDAIEVIPVPDSGQRGELLVNGDLDALHVTEPGTISDLTARPDLQVLLNDGNDESYLILNTTAAPFDDIRAREAFALATSRQNFIDLIGQGLVRGADQMFIPESPYFNPDVRQEADDPAAAAALAAEYCAERGSETNPTTGQPTCTDGRINIEYQHTGPDVVQTRIADLFEQGWEAAFHVTRQELLQDEHITQVALGQYNSAIWQGFGSLDPMTEAVWISCRSIGGLSLNWPRHCDEAIDENLLAAQNTTDPERRVEHYREMVRLLDASHAYVFLTHSLWAHVFADDVHGACDRRSPEGDLLRCTQGGALWPAAIWME